MPLQNAPIKAVCSESDGLQQKVGSLMEEYLQQVYEDAFDNAYAHFTLRKQEDPAFTKEFLQGLLDSMYTRQGNNWDGRGQAKDMMQSGMIAAAELVLTEWSQTA